ncbi:hypothetical protein PENTCL1PPCAC_23895, partial [Pristionchus entomophagus]
YFPSSNLFTTSKTHPPPPMPRIPLTWYSFANFEKLRRFPLVLERFRCESDFDKRFNSSTRACLSSVNF